MYTLGAGVDACDTCMLVVVHVVCAGSCLQSCDLFRRRCVLQPPFNEQARAAAGFGPNWYLPLSTEVLQ